MTAEHGSALCAEFPDLAAAVALDALNDLEARRVEQHAAECPTCAVVLQEMREAAALLASAVEQVDPPPAVRARTLAAARVDRPRPRRLFALGGRRLRFSPAWLVAAASMVVSIAAVAWVAVLQVQVRDLQVAAADERDRAGRYDQIVQVLGSPQLAVRPLTPVVQTVHSYGTIYLDPSTRTGMMTARGLPPVEPGHAWQLWFMKGNERYSGGMLWPDRAGNCYSLISVPPDVGSFDAVVVTEEPGQGSAWPTSQRILWGKISEQ